MCGVGYYVRVPRLLSPPPVWRGRCSAGVLHRMKHVTFDCVSCVAMMSRLSNVGGVFYTNVFKYHKCVR